MKKLLYILIVLAPLFAASEAHAAARFWVGGTGTWDASDTTHWASASNGAGGASVPGSGDTVTFDANSGGGTVTVGSGYNPTVTSITMGAASTTLDFSANNNSPTMTTFSNTGTGTRTLNMGNGTWTVTGNNATLWNMTTVTNLTFNAGSSTLNFTYSGSTGTRTFAHGGQAYSTVKVSAGSDSFSFASNLIVHTHFDFTGFTGTAPTNANITIGGSLTLGAGMTVANGSGLYTFTASTTGATITTNGVVFGHPITIIASTLNTGGTVTLGDDLDIGSNITRTLTVSRGTFDANNFDVTVGAFNSNVANVTRGIIMGSGQWTLTGSSTTLWNTSNISGATVSLGNPIRLSYSGSSGTRSITCSTAASGATEANAFSFEIIAGSDTVAFTGSRFIKSIDFTGFSGTLTAAIFFLYGSLTMSPTMTYAGAGNAISFFATSGTHTITANGQTFDNPITINAPGATIRLGDNVAVGTSTGTNRTFTLTAGTFDLNGKTLTHVGTVTNTGSVTRAVAFSGGIWDIKATTTATVWNATGSGFTTSGSGVIKISGSSTNTKTFAGGGYTYSALYYSNPTPGGQLTISGSNTFSNIGADNGPQTIAFTAASTQNVGGFTVSGSAGNLITITSTNTATFSLVKTGGGRVSVDYVDIAHSVATPANTWYAGANSVNSQATATAGSGWIFTVPPYIPAKNQFIGGKIRFFGGFFRIK